MTVQVTMLQTRLGEDGTLWTTGQSYSATDAFARLLVSSNLATATFPAVPQTALTAAQAQAVQTLFSGDVITVGTGGEYGTLEEAGERAIARSPTADRWARIVIMPNTNLVLSDLVELPQYCEMVGASRYSSVVTGNGNANIRYRKWNAFENFTLRYSGIGNRSAGFRSSDSIGSTLTDGSRLRWRDMGIEVTANHRSAIYLQAAQQIDIEGCQILTSGMGIEQAGGINTHVRGSDIWLSNTDTNQPHYGIHHTSGRMTLRGNKIATGYGPLVGESGGIAAEANQDIVGLYTAPTAGNHRIDIFDHWSIIRNEAGADSGKKLCCIWHNSNFSTTRVWSAYLQAENGTGTPSGDHFEILNSATPNADMGMVQITPSVRTRRTSGAITLHGPGVGLPNVVTATTGLLTGMGGLYRVNATSGNITITLPDPFMAGYTSAVTSGERYLFKRVVSGSNTITIAAAGAGITIQGDASVNLGASLYSQLEVVWSEADGMWLIV